MIFDLGPMAQPNRQTGTFVYFLQMMQHILTDIVSDETESTVGKTCTYCRGGVILKFAIHWHIEMFLTN